MIKKIFSMRTLIPLLIFLGIGYFFMRGLGLDPHLLPSTLLNQAAPEFNVSELYDQNKKLNKQIFLGHVSLLNVWASWCSPCMMEQPFLMEIAHKYPIKFYGLNYKDERESAKEFLQQFGNPYQLVGFDEFGKTAMDWGVYGTPETFVIDKKGIIRFKHSGPIYEEDWQQIILPIVEKLLRE